MANEIKLRPIQAEIWKGMKRFNIVLAGRRGGKSYFALAWIAHNAATMTRKDGQNTIHWIIAPTRSQVKEIYWRPLKRLFADHIVDKREDELELELRNGAIIKLKSADNPDGLHGSSLSSVVLDECRFYKEEVWEEGVSPATSDQLAKVLFITTPPEKHNWFTELWDNVQNDPDYKDWFSFAFTTLQGGNVPEAEVERARKQLDPRTFRRMYEGSMETMGNKVYSEFDRKIHVTEDIDVPLSEITEMYAGIDFNVDPMSAVLGVKTGDQIHILYEILIPDSNTHELAKEISRKFPRVSIQARPDPASRLRKTSAGFGVTDLSILENADFIVWAPKKHIRVMDRVNNVQAMLRNANGGTRLYIHPRCKHLIDSLSKQGFKEGTSIPDKDSGYDHMNDALGYLISAESPIIQNIKPFKMRLAM